MKDEEISNVQFLGYRKKKELAEQIKKSIFVVVPSEWYENNPFSIIEAFAMGKTVVGANIGGIPELVIDGATAHADHINSAVAGALTSIACDTGVPVIGSTVCVQNIEQATERCGTKAGNRGFDAACTAIEMAQLMKQVKA